MAEWAVEAQALLLVCHPQVLADGVVVGYLVRSLQVLALALVPPPESGQSTVFWAAAHRRGRLSQKSRNCRQAPATWAVTPSVCNPEIVPPVGGTTTPALLRVMTLARAVPTTADGTIRQVAG